MQATLGEQAKALAKAAHAAKKDELSRENRNFTQVYAPGWKRLRTLISENPAAAKIYAILAENIDAQAGAVVVAQAVLAEMVGASERTVRRATTYLEAKGALVRIKVGGGVYAYCLSPTEVWKAWDSQKDSAAFLTRTLVSKGADASTISRRLKLMVKEQQAEGDQAESVEEELELGYDPETGEIRE